MKKDRFIVFLVFIYFSIHYSIFAQEEVLIVHHIDSLNTAIESQQPSVERIKIRLSLIDAYRQISHEKATQEGIYTLQEAETFGNDSTLLLTKKKLGTCFYVSGDYEGALKYYGEALEIAAKMNHTREIGALNNNMGLVYRNMGMYEAAIKHFLEAIVLYEEIKSAAIAGTYRNLTSIYYSLEDYEKYIRISQHIQAFHLKHNDSLEWANITYNIAWAYMQWNQIPAVLEITEKILPIYERYNDEKGIALTLYLIGYVYVRELKEYEKGLEYLYRASHYNRLLNSNIELARCYIVMGTALLETDSVNRAFTFFDKSLNFYLAANELEGILNAYYELGTANNKIRNYKEAHKYFQLCLDKSEEYDDSRYLFDIHEAKIQTAFMLNDQESFIESYDIYTNYVDATYIELGNLKFEHSKVIDENQELREAFSKESDNNTELLSEITLYRSLTSFFGFLTFVLLILFIIFYKKQENK